MLITRDSAETRDAFRWPGGRFVFLACVSLGFLADAGVVGGAFFFLIGGWSIAQAYVWLDSLATLVAITAIIRFVRRGMWDAAFYAALVGAILRAAAISVAIVHSQLSDPLIVGGLTTLLVAITVAPLLAVAVMLRREGNRRATAIGS